MPRGRYRLYDPYDRTPLGEERFQCAPGPSGWRYVAARQTPSGEPGGSLDLTLDELGRPLRLDIRAGAWQLRGGALDGLTWVRTDATGAHAEEGNAAAHAFTGTSPAFLIATARLLRPAAEPVRVRLVALTEPVLAPRTTDQSWAYAGTEHHESDGARLAVHRYTVGDLHTGERHTVHLSGDVVLAAPGVELEELDAPPSDYPTTPPPGAADAGAEDRETTEPGTPEPGAPE